MSHPLHHNGKQRKWKIENGVAIFYLLFSSYAVCAKERGDVRNELPAPTGLSVVLLTKTITLTWQWPRPEELPVFKEFGFEVKRSDGKTFRVKDTAYLDTTISTGTYSYIVRVRGVAKEKGKLVTYVSDWTERVSGTINASCSGPPMVDLLVEPTQKTYASIPSLRFHIQGKATVDRSCTLGNVSYHLDTGTGIVHTSPLTVNSKGYFDTYVNAFGPEDEIPSGHASFAFTVTAEDEAGPATSDAFTLEMELRNPYAPH